MEGLLSKAFGAHCARDAPHSETSPMNATVATLLEP